MEVTIPLSEAFTYNVEELTSYTLRSDLAPTMVKFAAEELEFAFDHDSDTKVILCDEATDSPYIVVISADNNLLDDIRTALSFDEVCKDTAE